MAVPNTKWYSILESPAGHRMVMVSGRTGFTGSAKTRNITVSFTFLKAAQVTMAKPPATAKTIAYIRKYTPYVSATQFTTGGLTTARRVIVNRLTAKGVSTALFNYVLIGY